MEGWISLYRKLLNNEIMRKPPLYLKVWIWLLLKAQHNDYGNLKRGQLFTSISEIQDAMTYNVGYRKERPSKKQIWDILEWLRNPYEGITKETMTAPMIETTKVTHGLIITIVKYDIYQDNQENEGNNESNNEGTTKERRKERQGNNINNNDNNDNNNKNKIYNDAVQEIFNYYLETFKGFFKTCSLTDDRKRKIIARLKEGYTVEQIKTAIRNIRQSPFHCGENDSNKFYADISFICRNGGKLEEWMNYQPPVKEVKKEIPQSVLEQIRQKNEEVKNLKYDPKYLEEVRRIVQQS